MNRRTVLVLLAVIAFVCVGGTYLALQFFRELTPTETTLFHIMTWGIGLYASYAFAAIATRAGALDMFKPHARSSFRRIMALYNSLYRLSVRIDLIASQGVHPVEQSDPADQNQLQLRVTGFCPSHPGPLHSRR